MRKFQIKFMLLLVLGLFFVLGLGAPYVNAQEPPAGAYPVIYIPGIMGSVSTKLFNDREITLTFPLGGTSFYSLTVNFADWHVLTIPGITTHQNLQNTFAAKGLTAANGYFNYFPYDWRQPNAVTATGTGDSLMKKIDQVKALTGKSKVNLIAHSMGGLVARAYIQSALYRGDVNKLILLGTPNKGAVEAYYIWEGGIVKDPVKETVLLAILASYDYTMDGWTYIHTYCPSIKELLPTFDYLKNYYTGATISQSSMKEQNSWLKQLNAGISSLLNRGVRLRIFAGNNYSTPRTLRVRPHLDWLDHNRWADGFPLAQVNNTYGDNTVLLNSAAITGVTLITGTYKHQELPGKFAAAIVNFTLSG